MKNVDLGGALTSRSTKYTLGRAQRSPRCAPRAGSYELHAQHVAVPEPGDGRFVVEVTHISLEPAMRGDCDSEYARAIVAPFTRC